MKLLSKIFIGFIYVIGVIFGCIVSLALIVLGIVHNVIPSKTIKNLYNRLANWTNDFYEVDIPIID